MTGGKFTAARNRVRIIDFNRFPARFGHQIEIIKFEIDLTNWEGCGRDRSHASSQGTGEDISSQAKREIAVCDGEG